VTEAHAWRAAETRPTLSGKAAASTCGDDDFIDGQFDGDAFPPPAEDATPPPIRKRNGVTPAPSPPQLPGSPFRFADRVRTAERRFFAGAVTVFSASFGAS